jgi:hypothetical protein
MKRNASNNIVDKLTDLRREANLNRAKRLRLNCSNDPYKNLLQSLVQSLDNKANKDNEEGNMKSLIHFRRKNVVESKHRFEIVGDYLLCDHQTRGFHINASSFKNETFRLELPDDLKMWCGIGTNKIEDVVHIPSVLTPFCAQFLAITKSNHLVQYIIEEKNPVQVNICQVIHLDNSYKHYSINSQIGWEGYGNFIYIISSRHSDGSFQIIIFQLNNTEDKPVLPSNAPNLFHFKYKIIITREDVGMTSAIQSISFIHGMLKVYDKNCAKFYSLDEITKQVECENMICTGMCMNEFYSKLPDAIHLKTKPKCLFKVNTKDGELSFDNHLFHFIIKERATSEYCKYKVYDPSAIFVKQRPKNVSSELILDSHPAFKEQQMGPYFDFIDRKYRLISRCASEIIIYEMDKESKSLIKVYGYTANALKELITNESSFDENPRPRGRSNRYSLRERSRISYIETGDSLHFIDWMYLETHELFVVLLSTGEVVFLDHEKEGKILLSFKIDNLELEDEFWVHELDFRGDKLLIKSTNCHLQQHRIIFYILESNVINI